jgi:O-antigen/teichoic acid export membrane protein
MNAASNIPASSVVPVAVTESGELAEFRHRVGKISKHSLVYFAGMVFSGGAGYAFKIYVARALGAEALGLYALGMSMVGLLGVFNAIGLPTAAARFVAEYSSQHEHLKLGNFLRGSISLLAAGNFVLGAAFVFVLPWAAVHFYHAPALASYAGTFAVLMLIGVFNTFFSQCMAGFREIARRTVITHFAATSTTIILAVVLIELGFGLRGYLTAQVASSLLVLILLAFSIRKLTPQAAVSSSGFGRLDRKVASFSAITFAIGLVHFALGQSDKIILGYYLKPRDVGVYAVAVTVAAFVPVALQSANQIFSPMIAELHAAENHALLRRLYVFITKWATVITLPLAFSVIVFSRGLLSFFGPPFQAGATVLAIVAVAEIVNCGVGSVGFLLLMSGHQTQIMKIETTSAILMVSLSLLLVPRFGITGAGIAFAMSVIVTNIWSLVEVRKRLGLSPYNRSYLKLIPPAVAAISVLLVFHRTFAAFPNSWKVASAASLCAYAVFVAVLVSSGLQQEDRMLATLAWNRIRNRLARNGA